jgi:hypothetical protein
MFFFINIEGNKLKIRILNTIMQSPRLQKRERLIEHIPAIPSHLSTPTLPSLPLLTPQFLIKGIQPLKRVIPHFTSNKPIIHVLILIPLLVPTKVVVDVLEAIAGIEGFDEELVVVLVGLLGVLVGLL